MSWLRSRVHRSGPAMLPLFLRPRWCALLIVVLISSVASAQRPCVHFDVPDLVACRLVVQDQFQREHPHEKLVEATFDVSSLIRYGSESDLSQYLYVIESPQHTLRVFDYDPKTQLVTPHVGNLRIQQNSQQSANVGLNAALNTKLLASANGNASLGKSSGASVSYDLLPPKRLLASSGTISRGSAVYFKLKPSGQTSMDGSRRFTVVFRVPSSWRGDYVQLRCAAYDGSSTDKRPICGSSDFLVGIYLTGDETAQATVARFSRLDRSIRRLAAESQGVIEKHRFPSISDKLGALLHVSDPKIPDDWLRRSMGSSNPQSFERYLPTELRETLQQFRESRANVMDLNGTSSDLAAASL